MDAARAGKLPSERPTSTTIAAMRDRAIYIAFSKCRIGLSGFLGALLQVLLFRRLRAGCGECLDLGVGNWQHIVCVVHTTGRSGHRSRWGRSARSRSLRSLRGELGQGLLPERLAVVVRNQGLVRGARETKRCHARLASSCSHALPFGNYFPLKTCNRMTIRGLTARRWTGNPATFHSQGDKAGSFASPPLGGFALVQDVIG